MRVDELIFSQREFLKELHALCKKWNVSIGGDYITFRGGGFRRSTNFNNFTVNPEMLEIELIKDGYMETAYIRDRYHDISLTCEDWDMDGDGQYIVKRVTASCPKCGNSVTKADRSREDAERFAVQELEEMECK